MLLYQGSIVIFKLKQEFQRMETLLLIKLILMALFFLQVLIFGRYVSNMKCFKQGVLMSIAMTFSGTLFLSIALIDIIPEAIKDFQMYFMHNSSEIISTSRIHQEGHIPITMIIATTTYIGIMFIDKVLIQHKVDSIDTDQNFQLRTNKESSPQQLRNQGQQGNQNLQNQKNIKIQTISLKQPKQSQSINWRPIILQIGMGIHAFFETLATGLQKTTTSVITLAAAILIHKWAQGLTLGLIYKKEGFKPKTVNCMILFQCLINVLGMMAGIMLNGYGNLVMGFFMSVSAGTFLYISTAEVLLQQIKFFNVKKMISMVAAISFVAGLVKFEKLTGHGM